MDLRAGDLVKIDVEALRKHLIEEDQFEDHTDEILTKITNHALQIDCVAGIDDEYYNEEDNYNVGIAKAVSVKERNKQKHTPDFMCKDGHEVYYSDILCDIPIKYVTLVESKNKNNLNKKENKMKKNTMEKAKENAVFVAQIAFGNAVLQRIHKVGQKKLPIMVRGYMSEYEDLTNILIGFASARMAEQMFPDNEKLRIVVEAMETAALAKSGVNIGQWLDDIIESIEVPKELVQKVTKTTKA